MFLTDGNVPLDNGFSERIIRSYSIGRANWIFADTVKGAKVNATMYSIVETAKANGVDVLKYLQFLPERIPSYMQDHDSADPGFLESLMPWGSGFKTYAQDKNNQKMDLIRTMFPIPEKPKTPKKCDHLLLDHHSPPLSQIA